MIKLDISTAVFLYLLSSVIVVLVLWIAGSSGRKKVDFKNEIDYIRRCQICAHEFIDSKDEDYSKCPQCGSINKKGAPV